MRTPLDDIKFLANSGYRIRVLTRLADSPANRERLRQDIGISQPTLGRILNGLLERGWIRREGQEYRITASGNQLAEEFAQLEEHLERSQKLQLIEEMLPSSGLDVDLTLFEGAELSVPTPVEPLLPISEAIGVLRRADQVRGISHGVLPEAIAATREAVVDRGQQLDLVLAPDSIAVLQSDREMTEHVSDILSTGRATMYVHEGSIPCGVVVADRTVIVALTDEMGRLLGNVESTDAELRTWANELIDGFISRSRPIAPDDFAP